MAFKKLGRIMCAVALCGVAMAVPLTTSGCTTDHPEAEITVDFNGVTYVLEYKLYRNMYPQTVQHFIELADQGFYNDTIVHDVNSSDARWYCGGYDLVTKEGQSYDDAKAAYEAAYKDSDANVLMDYYEEASKEKEYATLADPAKGVITPTVYTDFVNGAYAKPLNTLIGEFSNNQHKIDNGALKKSFGSLSMFYTGKNKDKVKEALGTNYVYMDKYGSSAGVKGTYEYNSATSIFGIQSGTSTSTDSTHCIFGVLKNTDELTNLKNKVTSEASPSSKTVSIYVDNYDEIIGGNINEGIFHVAKLPIVIKSVKVTKY